VIIAGRDILTAFGRPHADARKPLAAWVRIVQDQVWRSIDDVRRIYPHADAAGTCTLFNIKGNAYRLIAKINYVAQVVDVRMVLTHAQYSKGAYENDCNC